MSYVFLAIAIIGEVIATSAMKASNSFTRLWPSVIVVCGYAVAFYSLSHAIRTIPLGIAYALWSGVGIVLITVAAYLLYSQRLDTPALIGMSLIIAGVLVINLFSKSTAH
ncbi:DMT family transporter [Chondromyces crocatus]|uniref:Multidrug transporter n=1 Tax=Chondromyces crocatus TaxID=52 RepID=A0A0K1E8X2_CHOCO|nr:SMR family transporter [Chondromyces crocatus]AKT37028.1 multidrug transporter [Chondromyces crocatus]